MLRALALVFRIAPECFTFPLRPRPCHRRVATAWQRCRSFVRLRARSAHVALREASC
jgi:hypothetical protein